MDADVTDNGDGTWSVYYTVEEPGDYTMALKYGGQPVPQGFYTFTVSTPLASCVLIAFLPVNVFWTTLRGETLDDAAPGPSDLYYHTVMMTEYYHTVMMTEYYHTVMMTEYYHTVMMTEYYHTVMMTEYYHTVMMTEYYHTVMMTEYYHAVMMTE